MDFPKINKKARWPGSTIGFPRCSGYLEKILLQGFGGWGHHPAFSGAFVGLQNRQDHGAVRMPGEGG